jgi:hypothetical protein
MQQLEIVATLVSSVKSEYHYDQQKRLNGRETPSKNKGSLKGERSGKEI